MFPAERSQAARSGNRSRQQGLVVPRRSGPSGSIVEVIDPSRKREANRGGLYCCLAVVGLLGMLILGSLALRSAVPGIPNDFFTFWLASRMGLAGESPYDATQWRAGHEQFQAEFVANKTYLYPVPLAVFIPLGLLPLHSAFTAWFVLAVLMMVAGVVLVLDSQHIQLTASSTLPIIAGVLLFRGTINALMFGQIAPMLFFAIALTMWLWTKRSKPRWFLGGLALSITLLKPSLGVPLVALLSIALLVRGNWAATQGLVFGSVFFWLVGFILDPSWVARYLRFAMPWGLGNLGYGPTLWGVAGTACSHQPTCFFVLGSVLSVALVAIWLYFALVKDGEAGETELVVLSIPVAVLVTHLWSYDQLLCLVSLIALSAMLRRRRAAFLVTSSIVLLVDLLALSLAAVAHKVNSDVWSVAVPVVVFFLVLLFAPRGTTRAASEEKPAYP